MREDRESWSSMADPVSDFARTCLVFSDDREARLSNDSMYSEFCDWLRADHPSKRPPSKQAFAERLKSASKDAENRGKLKHVRRGESMIRAWFYAFSPEWAERRELLQSREERKK